jgi:DNA-binding transcriptional MocR family regulator
MLVASIDDDLRQSRTLVESLTVRLSEEILRGQPPAGSRLMSIRKAAEQYGVSKNTVIEVYDRLVASGYATSRPGSGFVVCLPHDANRRTRPRHVAEAVDIASLLSAQLEESFEIRVGDGRPPQSWTEESEIKRYLSAFGRAYSAGTDAYGSALGFPGLRDEISKRLAGQHLKASDEEILLTFGANHALDLIVRAFLSPGDTVFVDEPGYYPLFAKLKLAQVRMIGVRRTPDGPDVEDFLTKAATERPRMFFTQSIGHNPTGSSTSLPVAHALLNAAATHNITIVEDDPFADLAISVPNRLVTLDQLNRVISVGTFSKTLSASLRSGYIVGNRQQIGALAELKMLTTVNSSGQVERLIHRLLAEGHYDRHLKRLANRIDGAALRVGQRLKQQGYEVFCGNGGGYYLYLLLPRHIDDIEFARRGAKESIFIAPGSVFCVSKENSVASGIRLNVARTDDERFYAFLARNLG